MRQHAQHATTAQDASVAAEPSPAAAPQASPCWLACQAANSSGETNRPLMRGRRSA